MKQIKIFRDEQEETVNLWLEQNNEDIVVDKIDFHIIDLKCQILEIITVVYTYVREEG